MQNLPIPNPGLRRRTEMLRKEKERMTKLAVHNSKPAIVNIGPLYSAGSRGGNILRGW